jgi:putative ABC transport system substrate-binding protein
MIIISNQWSVVSKSAFCFALCAMLFALCTCVSAQQKTKIPQIGYLSGATPEAQSTRTGAFRQGLRELGYVEEKNITIEYRYAAGKLDRYPALAAELLGLKVEVIVTGGPGPTRALKAATSTIPIVMAQDTDPVGNGFVASLARPGGNITGLSNFSPELSGKRLELLKEIVPKLSRVAIFGSSTNAQTLKEIELAARAFAVTLQHLDVQSSKDIETAFRAAVKGRAEAILTLVPGPIALAHRMEFAELAVKSRLPVMYERAIYVEDGGLTYYGVNVLDLDRRAAIYVDKILKGVKPADLPVEQPTKFEFVINLKAANQIGLTIPPNVLVRADRVIR